MINRFAGLSTDSGNAIFLNRDRRKSHRGQLHRHGSRRHDGSEQRRRRHHPWLGWQLHRRTDAGRPQRHLGLRKSRPLHPDQRQRHSGQLHRHAKGRPEPARQPAGIGFVGGGFADNNTIGGTAAGEANVIAFNDIYGVLANSQTTPATPSAATRSTTTERSASISAPAVRTPTTRWTPTTAPTTCRTSPSSARSSTSGPVGAGSTRIAGKLHSLPSTTFDLDFYANPACSNFPREFIEGET